METLYAYLAGAIDIDGRISISRARDYRRGDREITYYSAVISLSDSDPVLPDLLQATFSASRRQYEAKNRSHRKWHMWEAVGQKAQEPLIRLLPYLRIRHRQAGACVVADHLDAIRQGWICASTLGRARAGQTVAIRTGEIAQCDTTVTNLPVV